MASDASLANAATSFSSGNGVVCNSCFSCSDFKICDSYSTTFPVRGKVVLYESQILKSEQEKQELQTTPLPDEKEVAAFAKEASEAIQGLDFKAKKGIVTCVIERVVGTRDKLQVYGFIPVTTKTNVNVFT